MTAVSILDHAAVFVFALTGALTASRAQLDLVGFAFLATVTALGGGTSSRLFQEIRERRGLAYSVYSFASHHAESGVVGVAVGCLPAKLDEVLATIIDAGSSLGVPDRAATVVEQLRERIAVVTARVSSRDRPNVFVLEWSDPPFLSGHWVPDLVTAAGGNPILSERGSRSVPTDWTTIAQHDPDIVVAAPCGFGLDGAIAQADTVLGKLPDRAEVWAIDADGLVVRPGPRVVDGVEAFSLIFHPDGVAVHPATRQIR